MGEEDSPRRDPRPHMGQGAPPRMGFQYTGPPSEKTRQGLRDPEDQFYNESTVELDGSQNPSPTSDGDARNVKEKTGEHDGWYEEDIRPQAKEAT